MLSQETSGVRSLEQRLLEREVQVMRLRSECEKKEEVQDVATVLRQLTS